MDCGESCRRDPGALLSFYRTYDGDASTHTLLTCSISFIRQSFFKELVVSALFSVAVLVVPVWLQLNHLPRWILLVILYLFYNFGVSPSGMGSMLSPTTNLAMWTLNSNQNSYMETFKHTTMESTNALHMVASLLGGLIGGQIMRRYFPDE